MNSLYKSFRFYLPRINAVIKNTNLLFKYRNFLFFSIYKLLIYEVPLNKRYLVNTDFMDINWSRDFLLYEVKNVISHRNRMTRELFLDQNSINLYNLLYKRRLYSSYLLSGWDVFFDDERSFDAHLKQALSKISLHKTKAKVRNDLTLITEPNSSLGIYTLDLKKYGSYHLPINEFQINVFCYQLGLVELEVKCLRYIKNKNLIDVGAYYGDSTIVLANYTKGKVIAFEPEPTLFNLLKKTVEINKLTNKVESYPIALSDHTKKIVDKNISKLHVSITSLDKFYLNKYSVPIGLIKVDTEGCEEEILKGCDQVIRKYKPILFLSIYHTGKEFIYIPLYIKQKYSHIYVMRMIDTNPLTPMAEKVLVCLPKI